ncbi:MAG: paraquat-inducible protein A [Pseudomonadota bacterium]
MTKSRIDGAVGARTAAALGYASCHTCFKLVPIQSGAARVCPRCGSTVHSRIPGSLQNTLALLITAVVLYVPANVLPILYTDRFGQTADSTILGGVVQLVNMGSYPIALVIFIASVVVPLAKIAALFYLCLRLQTVNRGKSRQKTKLYEMTELVGKWSMVDVFVVAVLVGLVQLTGLIEFRPGPAALAFAGVVIATMFAAEGLDQRLIWDKVSTGDGQQRD